jgi:hypothetical protein
MWLPFHAAGQPVLPLLFELLLAAFLVRVIMGFASRRAPGAFASLAIG